MQITFHQFYINILCNPQKSRSVSHKFIIPTREKIILITYDATCDVISMKIPNYLILYYVSSWRSKTKLAFYSINTRFSPSISFEGQSIWKTRAGDTFFYTIPKCDVRGTLYMCCVRSNELNGHTILFIPGTKQFAILNHYTRRRMWKKTTTKNDMNGEKNTSNHFLRVK